MKKKILHINIILILASIACGVTINYGNATVEPIEIDNAPSITTENNTEAEITENNIQLSPTPLIEKTPTPISLNTVVTLENTFEWFIVEINTGDRIDPPTPDQYYSYYEVKDFSKTYIDVVISVKNLMTSSVRASEIANMELIYDEKYSYQGFSIIEEDGGGDFTYSNITAIDPLTSGRLHFLIEVPDQVVDDEKPVDLILTIHGDEYSFIYK